MKRKAAIEEQFDLIAREYDSERRKFIPFENTEKCVISLIAGKIKDQQ